MVNQWEGRLSLLGEDYHLLGGPTGLAWLSIVVCKDGKRWPKDEGDFFVHSHEPCKLPDDSQVMMSTRKRTIV